MTIGVLPASRLLHPRSESVAESQRTLARFVRRMGFIEVSNVQSCSISGRPTSGVADPVPTASDTDAFEFPETIGDRIVDGGGVVAQNDLKAAAHFGLGRGEDEIVDLPQSFTDPIREGNEEGGPVGLAPEPRSGRRPPRASAIADCA